MYSNVYLKHTFSWLITGHTDNNPERNKKQGTAGYNAKTI